MGDLVSKHILGSSCLQYVLSILQILESNWCPPLSSLPSSSSSSSLPSSSSSSFLFYSAGFKTLRDKFEFDSFFIRSCLDHTSTDPRDMKLHQGTLMRVVNTILYGGNFWLAWTVDESTGLDSELRRIPSPAK